VKNKPVKANKLAIEALPARRDKYEVSVVGHRGLIVRVWPSGERTFVYRHRQNGQLRRLALKATSLLSAAVAEWAGERRDAHAGVDVVSRRHDDRNQKKLKRVTDRRDPTVVDLIERYVDEHAKPHKRSWSADESLLNRFVSKDLGSLKAKTIKRADVHSLVHKVAHKHPRKPTGCSL
jgi:hypothetical protein